MRNIGFKVRESSKIEERIEIISESKAVVKRKDAKSKEDLKNFKKMREKSFKIESKVHHIGIDNGKIDRSYNNFKKLSETGRIIKKFV